MIFYNHMALFVAIVREGSISGTAQLLDMPKSTLSLRLKELEQELGVRLMQRNTRHMRLTEHGRLFFRQCQSMLEQGELALDMMKGLQEEPRGTLRITCPYGMSDSLMPQIIERFTDDFPQVKIELLASNERVDIVADGIDIALRLGPMEDSSLIARKVTDSRSWPLASQDYLEKFGEPSKPGDLLKHRCIVSFFTPRWSFRVGKRVEEITPEPYIRLSDVMMAKRLAMDGIGICMLPDVMIKDEVADGDLVPLLLDHPMESRPWNLVFPSRHLQSASVKRFIDMAMDIYRDPAHASV